MSPTRYCDDHRPIGWRKSPRTASSIRTGPDHGDGLAPKYFSVTDGNVRSRDHHDARSTRSNAITSCPCSAAAQTNPAAFNRIASSVTATAHKRKHRQLAVNLVIDITEVTALPS